MPAVAPFNPASSSLTVEDLAAAVRGCNSVLALLAEVWPQAELGELLTKAKEIQDTPAAQELLHQVVVLRKLRLE